MDFIATYWWVWLIGVVAALAVVAVRFVINMIGLAQDATELARKVRRVAEASAERRRQALADMALATVGDKLKKRAVNTAANAVLLLVGGGCGVLLVVALVQRLQNGGA